MCSASGGRRRSNSRPTSRISTATRAERARAASASSSTTNKHRPYQQPVDKTCEKAKGSIKETGGVFLCAFLLCLCGDDADAAAAAIMTGFFSFFRLPFFPAEAGAPPAAQAARDRLAGRHPGGERHRVLFAACLKNAQNSKLKFVQHFPASPVTFCLPQTSNQ